MTTAIATTIPDVPKRDTALKTAVRTPEGKRMTIGRKLKRALDLMIWEGKPWNEAAQEASFDVASMRKALERPHVRQYLKEQKQVFRASVSAQNISVLADIRDKSENAMARLGAVKLLEQVDEQQERQATIRAPGAVIVIGIAPGNMGHDSANVAKSLIDNSGVRVIDGERAIDVTPGEGHR